MEAKTKIFDYNGPITIEFIAGETELWIGLVVGLGLPEVSVTEDRRLAVAHCTAINTTGHKVLFETESGKFAINASAMWYLRTPDGKMIWRNPEAPHEPKTEQLD